MAVKNDKPDRISGSVDLFDAAAWAVREHLVRRGTADFGDLLDSLRAEHPSMALRLNFLGTLRDAARSGREAALEAVEAFGRGVAGARVTVAAQFASLVHARGWKSAATYSRSGQVREALAVARAAGLGRVVLSEARPAGEGYLLAGELRAEGFAVEMTADAVLPNLLTGAQVFVVGADANLEDGFANKAGTALLMREARRMGLETAVLTVPQKALRGEAALGWSNLPMDPPREAKKLRRGVTWVGDLFEVVPWDLAGTVLGRD